MQVMVKLLKKLGVDPADFTVKGMLTVVGIFILGLGVFATANMALGRLTLPLAEAFGVDRTVISFGGTLSKIAGALGALVFGQVYKKLSLKGVVLMATITLAIQYVIIAVGGSVFWSLVAFFIGGFGTQFAGGTLIITAIKPWFPRNVGVFAAICGTASGFGGTIFTPLFTQRITDNGYASACWWMAMVVAIMGAVCVFLVFMSPDDPLRKRSKEEEAALKAAKEAAAQNKAVANAGIPSLGYMDFLKCPASWLLMGMMFLAAGTLQPYLNALHGIADWMGFEDAAMVSAAALAGHAALLVWAKFIMGYLKDRNWAKFGVILAYSLNIIAVAGTLFFCKTPGMFTFYGTINAFASTSTGLFINLCAVQAFGKYNNAIINGMTAFTFNIGRAIGLALVHLPYDLWGSYEVTLWATMIAGVLMMVGLLAALKIGNATERALDKKYGIGEFATVTADKE